MAQKKADKIGIAYTHNTVIHTTHIPSPSKSTAQALYNYTVAEMRHFKLGPEYIGRADGQLCVRM
jgi:hypothetical protein